MKLISAIVLSILVTVGPAQASDPAWFDCTRIKTVTGIEDWQPHLKIGLLGDFDGKNYILVNGWVEAPSTGYKYDFRLDRTEAETVTATLKCIPPQTGGAMISKLHINERFVYAHNIQRIEIRFAKEFNWGPDKVTCDIS